MSDKGLSPAISGPDRPPVGVPGIAPGITVEPELRRVTVLVADLQGSTALIQDLDEEDAALLIDPALLAMIEAAERFDGAISHRGDGIMVIFGAPTVAEDHALRACLAALAMQGAVARAGTFKLRIGIHSGPVVFRPVRINGSLVQDAVGIAVHIAARLEQSAEPGSICLSDSVVALAGNYLRTAPLVPIQVKGIEAPMARHLLAGAEPTANRWAVRAGRGLSPFIGRRAEAAALAAGLDAPDTAVVQIVGPAGMGKSRLIHEFLRSEPARARHVIVWTGDHLRHFAPFQPVIAWLHAWLGIRDADGAELARTRLAAGLAAIGPIDRLDPALIETLLGLGPSDPPGQRLDFGPTIAALMAALAGNRRLLLVCEDADRFDPAVLELLDSALLHLAPAVPLVVTASRTRIRFASIQAAQLRPLPLGPLSDAEATALLAAIEPGRRSPPGRAADILDKAGGNPLFLEEVAPLVAQSFADAQTEIPDRVDELIADRLGRLTPELRSIVQLCAVIGPDVPLRILAPLSGLAPAVLEAALANLEREQLLYESRKYPDPQVTFKHALTREVAYRTILVGRRRAQHDRIVDILAADPGDLARNIDALCHHALKAQRWEIAVEHLRIAARNSIRRTAFQAAIAALRLARETAARLPASDAAAHLRLDVLGELLAIVHTCGSYAELGPVLDEADELAAALGDQPRLIDLHLTRVHMFNITGRLDEAIALGERASAAARAQGESQLLLKSTFNTGQTYFNAGRLAEAERRLGDTLLTADDVATRDGPGAVVATYRTLAHGTRAMARCMRGALAAAEEDVAAAHAAHSARPYDRIFTAAAAGFIATERRMPDIAAEHYNVALELSASSGIVQLRPPALAGLGHTLLMRGETAAASETLSAAYRLAGTEQRWMFQLFAALGLALAGLTLGEPDLARSFADSALSLADRYGFKGFGIVALRVHGIVLALTAGRSDEGEAELRSAIARAQSAGMLAEVARGHAALAVVGAADPGHHLRISETLHGALGLAAHFIRIEADIGAGRVPYL